MNDYEIFEFLEMDECSSYALKKRQRRSLRDHTNPFDLGDSEFIRQYGLSTELASNLITEITPLFKKPTKSTDLTVETKVLTALSFYASGSYQKRTSNKCIMSQQTVSASLSLVTTKLNCEEMQRKYIKFPQTIEEKDAVKSEYYSKFGMPGVVGCLACTHVGIIKPGEIDDIYRHGKHHSLNVQIICDSDNNITSVDATSGGSTRDADIWVSHPIHASLKNELNKDTWLLADSRYPPQKYLMTPIVKAKPKKPEEHYNELHRKAYSTAEQTICQLKTRFRCLSSRLLYYKPDIAGSIINACVLLHNICNKANLPLDGVSYSMKNEIGGSFACDNEIGEGSREIEAKEGLKARSRLAKRLWKEKSS